MVTDRSDKVLANGSQDRAPAALARLDSQLQQSAAPAATAPGKG